MQLRDAINYAKATWQWHSVIRLYGAGIANSAITMTAANRQQSEKVMLLAYVQLHIDAGILQLPVIRHIIVPHVTQSRIQSLVPQ